MGSGGWAEAASGNVLYGAVNAGEEANGTPLYACRAWYNNGLHPGKVRQGFRGCNIGYGGAEIAVSHYEVLVH
ncbi:DM9 repeat-containing protein [Pararhodobacter sp. CCB-MM2]|uniref:DM9 repeat-containing protein n=1 Tax=Pararhodobacter sp. CCB-MM2 TaxID=1786003 RepID=UPI001314F407